MEKYNFVRNTDGFLTGYFLVQHGSYEYEGELPADVLRGWTRFNGEFTVDANVKTEIEKRAEIDELKSRLLNSDYIVAETFESIASLNSSITFITDFIKILVDFRTKFASILEDRKAWRERLKELEQ